MIVLILKVFLVVSVIVLTLWVQTLRNKRDAYIHELKNIIREIDLHDCSDGDSNTTTRLVENIRLRASNTLYTVSNDHEYLFDKWSPKLIRLKERRSHETA